MESQNYLQANDNYIMIRRNSIIETDPNRIRVPRKIRSEEDFRTLPPGYRFEPRDDELIKFYLRKKIMNEELPVNRIHEVPLYDYHPEKLTAQYKLERETKWYFFTTPKKKYPKGNRPSRSTSDGHWKPTGTDKTVNDKGEIIGYRKSLDYYTGKNPRGNKTVWKMHEYKLEKMNVSTLHGENDCVLCKVYKKGSKEQKNTDFENKINETKSSSTDFTSDEATSAPNQVPEIEEPVCHESLATERVDIEMDYDFLQFQDYKDPLDSIINSDECC